MDNTCSAFYICQSGFRSFFSTCQTGTYFNVRTAQCEDTAPAGCIDNICNNKGNGWYVDNDRCKSSYRCLNQNKVNTISCPSGQYFDIQAESCVNTVPATCQRKSSLWTIDHWTTKPLNHYTIEPQTTGPLNHWTPKTLYHGASEPLNNGTIEILNHWNPDQILCRENIGARYSIF